MTIEELNVLITAETRGLRNELNNVRRQLNSVNRDVTRSTSGMSAAFKKVGLVIASALAVKKLVDFGKASIELASDLTEVQNVVDVTFGQMSQEINAWSKSTLEDFGLSELSAKKYSSTLGAMMKSSGLAGEQMKDMSKTLTELSADMASFYNLSNDEAFNKIRSGISGETEPLKQLGINMSVANLEAYALSQGITKSYQSMNQAEQTLLRYNYLLSVSKDAQGDFTRTSGSWANQVKLLNEQWNILKGTIGQGLINALTPVLRVVNTLIARLQTVAQYFKAFTTAIFGSQEDVGSSSGQAAENLGGVSDAAGTAADGVKKAEKKIQGSLQGFDELNTLTQNTAGSLDGISEDIGIGEIDTSGGEAQFNIGVDIEDEKVEMFKQKLVELKTVAKSVSDYFKATFGPSISEAIGLVRPEIEKWEIALENTFKDFSGLSQPLKDWAKGDLIPFWQSLIVNMGEIAAGLSDSLLVVFEDMRKSIMPIFEWLAKDGLSLLTDMTDGAREIFMSLFKNTKEIFDRIWKEAVSPALKLVSDIILDVLTTIKDWWDEWGEEIVSGITTAFDKIKELFVTLWDNFLGPIVTKGLEMLRWLWEEHLKGLIEKVGELVGTLVDAALDIFNEFIAPVAGFLIEILGPAFSDTISFVIDIVGTMLATIIDIASGIITSLTGIVEFIAGVFTGDWERAWRGIKTIVIGIWTTIKAFFGTILEAIATNILEVWNAIKSFLIDSWNSIKNIAITLFTNIKDSIVKIFNEAKTIISNIWNGIKENLSNLWNNIKDTANTVFTSIKDTIANIFTAVKTSISNIWNSITSNLSSLWSGIKNTATTIFTSIKDSITKIFTAAKASISNIWDNIAMKLSNVWNSIKDTAKAAWDGIWNIIKGVINSIIRGINRFINAWNSIELSVPEVDIPFGGTVGGFSIGVPKIPDIPMLARGGIVDQPTLAMIGEQGKEAVVPLENTAFVDTLASAVGSAVMAAMQMVEQQSSGSGQSGDIVIQVEGTTIARVINPFLEREQQRLGSTIIQPL